MKLVLRSFVCVLFITLTVVSLNLKGRNELKAGSKVDYTKPWQKLFGTSQQPTQICSNPDFSSDHDEHDNNNNHNHNHNEDDHGADDDYSTTESKKPHTKVNPYAAEDGLGHSAYLFDYLDDTLQSDVSDLFKSIWKSAKDVKNADPKVYPEPYALDNILYAFSNGSSGSEGSINSKPSADTFSKIGNYIQGFNKEVWQNAITVSQVHEIIANWGWTRNSRATDFARKLVDTYDFDGDGRLNPSEFILMSIVNNKKVWTSASCKNCYDKIFEKKIDPIFAYLDCDNDGLINAENMWIGLEKLQRGKADTYNMYKCMMPSSLNKGFRTSSVNDFILNNHHQSEGFLTLNEFRTGILHGYWHRQVNNLKILTDDSINKKSTRWDSKGKTDLNCQDILSMIPSQTPIAPVTGKVAPTQSTSNKSTTSKRDSKPTTNNKSNKK